ncbi:hypothetical protein KAH37_09075, partial [bacterium]|nr:hypothetical protein [bacterium]
MADLSDGLFTPAEERQMAVDRVLQEENAVKEREKKETLKWRNYIDTMYGFWTTLDSDFFIATRNLLIRSSEYNPHVDSIATLHEIMHSSNFNAQTYWHIPLMHRNLLLTPRVHREIADMLEDPHKATKELWIANACCQGILSTGDGTREHPYKILRISDEEDIILYLGKKSIAQRTTLFIKKMW